METRKKNAQVAVLAKIEDARTKSTNTSFIQKKLRSSRGEDAERSQSHVLESSGFTEDFLERLAIAEQRDGENLTNKHLSAAAALDALLLEDSAGGDELTTGPSDPAAVREAIIKPIVPTHEELQRVVQLYWKSPVEKRNHMAVSSAAVEGSFVVQDEVLDEPTFCKLVALVQKPALGKRGHSRAQREGWHVSFNSMDFDNEGVLSFEKVRRFTNRRARAYRETVKEQAASAKIFEQGSSAIAAQLQSRVDEHLNQQRSRDAALSALEEAIEEGATFAAIFPLVMAIAPPFFGCERATLWLVRDAVVSEGGGGGGDAPFTTPDARGLGQNKHASFKQSRFKLDGDAQHADAARGRSRTRSRDRGTRAIQIDALPRRRRVLWAKVPPAAENEAGWWTNNTTGIDRLAETSSSIGSAAGGGGSSDEVEITVDKRSIVGTAVAACEIQLVGNAYADSRFDTSWDERSGFVTRGVLCIPLFGQAPAAPSADAAADEGPNCIGCLQLVNKLPKDVMPPAEFKSRDVRAGQAFCSKLSEAIEAALPREAELAAREAERALVEAARAERKRQAREKDAERNAAMRKTKRHRRHRQIRESIASIHAGATS